MTDISVIIMVGKEKIHMRRCMEKLAPLEPREVALCTIVVGNSAKYIKNRELRNV